MTNKNLSSCVYCNRVNIPLTREHIIPRCFYKQSRSNVRSGDLCVLACEECNNSKSKYDERFRNLMVKTCAHLNFEANELLTVVQRSVSKNRKFQNEMNDTNLEAVFIPKYNEELLKIKDPGLDVFAYVKVLAKAIYNLETNLVLDQDTYVSSVKQFDPINKMRFDPGANWISDRGFNKRVMSKDKIFQYIFQIKDKDIIILLSFFEFENFLVLFNKKT